MIPANQIDLQFLVQILIENQEIIVPLLVVIGGMFRSYKKTGRVGLKTLPWKAIRQVIYTVRRMYFTVSEPPTAQIDRPIEDVKEELYANHFESGFWLSYRYKGEDGNFRRPEGKKNGRNQQLHIRLFDRPDGTTGVSAHKEASPLQHPKAHIKEYDFVDVSAEVAKEYGTEKATE